MANDLIAAITPRTKLIWAFRVLADLILILIADLEKTNSMNSAKFIFFWICRQICPILDP